MKKFIISLLVLFALCANVSAQFKDYDPNASSPVKTEKSTKFKGRFAYALNLAYAGKYDMYGIGSEFRYEFMEDYQVELSFNFFPEKDDYDIESYHANLNLLRLFNISSGLRIYPLAGLSYVNWTKYYDYDSNSIHKIAVNIGAGLQCNLSKHFSAYADAKYQIIQKQNQLVIKAGVMYWF